MSGTESVALDRQRCTVVNKLTKLPEEISAIDRYFMEERNFLAYQAPPLSLLTKDKLTFQADLDEYEERLMLIEQDLKWLLSLPYQKFWCQVVFDSSCQNLIDSYLKLAPRPHDAAKVKLLPARIVGLHDSIHHYVFLVCLRMSTYRETKENFLTPEGFAQLIYNHFLFDIPKILDICVLYKKNEIVSKMIENVFNLQRNYFDDFKRCVKDIVKAIEITKKKLRDIFDLDAIYKFDASKNLQQKTSSLNEKIVKKSREVFEFIYYLTDFVYTLNHLIDLQPKLADSLFDAKFEHLIKDLEEGTIFAIEDVLDSMLKEPEFSETASLIKQKLKKLKLDLAKLFYKMLRLCSIGPIVDNLDKGRNNEEHNMQHYVDTFVKIICDLIDDKRFLCYLEEKFQMSEQIQLIVEIADDKIDKSQYEYIIANIKETILANSKKTSIKARFEGKPKSSKAKESGTHASSQQPTTSSASAAACASADPDYLASESDKQKVQSVLDLFPDQDAALVRKYLKYYKGDVEQLINALLENNLPPIVQEEPRASAGSSKTNVAKLEALIDEYEDPDDIDIDQLKKQIQFDELSARQNIFDGDEFDVFNKDRVDMTKIHQGKKSNADAFDLDDKSDIRRMDYSKYAYVRDGPDDDDERAANDYEDEYDDTYDEHTDVVEPSGPDLITIKPLNKKLGIKKRDQFEDDDDEEGDEDDEEDNETPTASNTASAGPSRNPTGSSRGGRFDRNQQSNQQFNRPNQGGQQRQQQFNKNNKFDYEQQPQYSRDQKGKNFYDNLHSRGGPQNRGQNAQPARPQQGGPANPQQGGDVGRQQRDQLQSSNRPQAPPNDRDQPQARRQQEPLPQRQPKQNQNQTRGPRPDNNQPRNQNNAQASNRNRNEPPQNERPQNEYDGNPLNYRPPQPAADNREKTEEEIKRERRWKNDNKAKVVHHNRRDLAAKKMNQGLGL